MHPEHSNPSEIMALDKATHEVERVLVGAVSFDMYLEHLARYMFAGPYISGLAALDVACGTGYGSFFLAERNAERITGADISQAAVQYAAIRYRSQNLSFCSADASCLPFRSGSFEVVVSFETLEHLENPGAFVSECRRVLRPNSSLIISTPNRMFHERLGIRVPYHRREFSLEEFRLLIDGFFEIKGFFGQMPVRIERLSKARKEGSALSCLSPYIPRRVKDLLKPLYESVRYRLPLMAAIRYHWSARQSNAAFYPTDVPERFRVVPADRLGAGEVFKTHVLIARARPDGRAPGN